MEHINFYTFEDKFSQEEISKEDGTSFYKAFGIVISINTELVSQDKEGILVCYRTPKAILKREYRSIQNIELEKVDRDTWVVLKELIQGSKENDTSDLKRFIFKPTDNLLQQYHQDRYR